MSLQDALANMCAESPTARHDLSGLPFGAGDCYEGAATVGEEP